MSQEGVITAFVDQVARDKAQKALDEIDGHERLCAERYGNINDSLDNVISILKWAGSTISLMLISTLAWLLVQQFNRNDDDKAMLQAQIELLQQHQQLPTTAASGSTVR